ncbi:MAG: aldolase/citrate lyase family protein [Vicinamibacterales bacterium]
MNTKTLTTLITLLTCVLIGAPAHDAVAQFSAADFEYGDRFKMADGETAEIWNPAMRKLLDGGPMIGGTVRATDPRTYCAMAAAGYDFIWVEMQHEATTWEQVSRFWKTCPGPAAPGVRVAYADEREIQHATDMGAAVIVVPTVDSVEEAQEAVNWTYFPPIGRRSAGGGQGMSEIWNEVPGGYRQTWNDNVVLILMIETLEGVEAAREIAKLPGVDGLFAASGDLGNFSGFGEGDAEYEAIITEVATAAKDAGIHACAPLRWADRPEFTCFQAATEGANIRRGAAAELQQAAERFGSTGGGGAGRTASSAGPILANLIAECGSITYEADCFSAVESAAEAAAGMSDSDKALIGRRVRELIAANPSQASQIRNIASSGGLDVG